MSAPDVYGLDTSVILRLIMGLPEDLAEAAFKFVNETHADAQFFVSDLVVVETYFALHTHYEIPKDEALGALQNLLESGRVEPEPGGQALEAIRATLESSKRLGFADRLIHAGYRHHKASMLTFEKSASKLPGTHLLKV